MAAEWEILKLKDEIKIMKKYAKNGRRYTVFYAGKNYRKNRYIMNLKILKLINLYYKSFY